MHFKTLFRITIRIYQFVRKLVILYDFFGEFPYFKKLLFELLLALLKRG